MIRVVVLATGGTIGSHFSAEHGAVIAGVKGEELVRNLGHFSPTVDVVTEQYCNVGSFLFTLELAFDIVKRADLLLQDAEVTGGVVTCGPDTMEEFAYLADLLHWRAASVRPSRQRRSAQFAQRHFGRGLEGGERIGRRHCL